MSLDTVSRNSKRKPFDFLKRKFSRQSVRMPSFLSATNSISSKTSRSSENSRKPRPVSQFFLPREDSYDSDTFDLTHLSNTTSYSLRTPVKIQKRMSAIVTRSEWGAPKEEMRPMSIWRDTLTEMDKPCLCDDKDCVYEFFLDPNLFKERPILEKQRFVRKPSTREETMRKFVLNEIIDTEKSYNQLLTLIFTKYMQPMIAEGTKSRPLIKASYIPLLFEHLPELLELSNDILTQMKDKSNELESVFQQAQSKFFVFIKYTMHYKYNEKEIRKACNNVLFIKIDQQNLSKRDTKRLGMFDYFIAPIQRVTRYCLLMQDLQKYSIPFNPELEKAIKEMKALAAAMDSI
ncbi:Dbl homology domain-containing protein [Sporodiniella umbellata]|nr:Dbl homology domain-containing protein [Sporodiniella umbellata]